MKFGQLQRFLATSAWFQTARDVCYLAKKRAYYSQHGEDIYLANHIFNNKSNGFYIDIGASHPMRISNTYLFYKHGWAGVVIEPISRLIKLHRFWRPRDIQIQAIVGSMNMTVTKFFYLYPSVLSTINQETAAEHLRTGTAHIIEEQNLPVLSLDQIITDFVPPSVTIDFLNIDVEGADIAIASQLIETAIKPPTVVCIEANTPAAEEAISEIMQCRYILKQKFGPNLIFLHRT